VVTCGTDATLTLAARELVLENRTDIGIRVVKSGFPEYGAKMKAWYSDYRPDHWVKVMQRRRPKYLRAYKNTLLDDIHTGKAEGKLLQAAGTQRVYIVNNCSRKFIPDVATFTHLKLDFADVELLPPAEFDRIPSGEDIVTGSDKLPEATCHTSIASSHHHLLI
jgi:hypothetical protein